MDGEAPQNSFFGLDQCVNVDLNKVDDSFAYNIEGESGMVIEFEGRCGSAVSIYSRRKNEVWVEDYVCEAGEIVDCSNNGGKSSSSKKVSIATNPNKDYLVVVVGVPGKVSKDSSFELDVVCEAPFELTCGEEAVTKTNKLEGTIPTFYNDLDQCSSIDADFPWRDASEVYNVVGKQDMTISFGAECKTDKSNKNALLVYSRDVGNDNVGPTEGYECEESVELKCGKKGKTSSLDIVAKEGKEYLLIIASQGLGDVVSVEVSCVKPTAAPTSAPTVAPTAEPKTLKAIAKNHIKKQIGNKLSLRKSRFQTKAETTMTLKTIVDDHHRALGASRGRYSAIEERRNA